MNLPEKFQTSKGTTRSELTEELAKWHCVLHLFAEATGDDPYLARHIKEAIDASLAEDQTLDDSLPHFTDAAFRLIAEYNELEASYGLHHLDLRGGVYDPLFAREALLGGLKKVGGYSTSLVLVTGLREAICGPGQRFSAKRRAAYAEAKDYLDSLAAEWTTPYTSLTLLYT